MSLDPDPPALHQQAVSLKCIQCGGAEFRYASDPQDETVFTCTACGATATLAELRTKAVGDHLHETAGRLVSDALKGMKGWKQKR